MICCSGVTCLSYFPLPFSPLSHNYCIIWICSDGYRFVIKLICHIAMGIWMLPEVIYLIPWVPAALVIQGLAVQFYIIKVACLVKYKVVLTCWSIYQHPHTKATLYEIWPVEIFTKKGYSMPHVMHMLVKWHYFKIYKI